MATKAQLERDTIARRLADYCGMAYDDAVALRRIEMTLQRWGELECGDGNGVIERDEKTGVPYWYAANARYLGANDRRAYSRIADRERGALKRMAAIMAKYPGVIAYHQGDPRGCAVYVIRSQDVPAGASVDSCYTRGVAVCA
jgi:hypothetical protein